jgi:hypothetical protein
MSVRRAAAEKGMHAIRFVADELEVIQESLAHHNAAAAAPMTALLAFAWG